MAGSNPLVAGPVDMSTPFTGAFLLEDGESLAAAIESGDWVQGGLAALSGAVDLAATVSDPLGSLIAAGLGWCMEHLEPLKGWMNDLTGDAGEVAGFAATWRNVESQLKMSGEELTRLISELDGQDGDAIAAYRAFQQEAGEHITASASWAGAMATGLDICSTIVKIVHDITRDAIAEIVGAVISYAAELVLTLGLATPLVIEQVSTRVASLVGRVGKSVTTLLSSGKALRSLLDELQALLKRADELFNGTLRQGDELPTPTPAVPAKPKPYSKPGSRPSLRPSTVKEVWDRAVQDSIDAGLGGRVFDPNTGEEIFWTPGTTRIGAWDMGHIPGQRYHDMWLAYIRGDMTPKEFRDWYNDADNYRPETPGSNRSNKYS